MKPKTKKLYKVLNGTKSKDGSEFEIMRDKCIAFVEKKRYDKDFYSYDIVNCTLASYLEYRTGDKPYRLFKINQRGYGR